MALNALDLSMLRDALGLIETRGLVGALEAADAASKAADVRISSISSNDDALVVIRIEGDLGAVQAAVDAGAQAARKLGHLIIARVFGRPTEELTGLLDDTPGGTEIPVLRRKPADSVPRPVAAPKPARAIKATRPTPAARPVPQPEESPRAEKALVEPPKPAPTAQTTAGTLSMADLEALPVVKLRQYARTLADLPIQGRQISMANKQQLLEAIRSISAAG